jgi:hypothetical protein
MSSGRRTVSWPENCIFPRVVRRAQQLVSCSVGSEGNCVVGSLPVNPVVNTAILACASISCCCSCIQPLFAAYPVCSIQVIKYVKCAQVVSIRVLKVVQGSYKEIIGDP